MTDSERDGRAIDELLSDIFAYMDMLRRDHQLDVTVHWLDHVLHTCADRLLACNIHKNPFCVYLKTETALWAHCIERQDKVLAICKELGATEYYNAIGGQQLYSKEDFARQGIRLSFLDTRPIRYAQGSGEFQPNLSILDVLMYNPKEQVQEMLREYDLR